MTVNLHALTGAYALNALDDLERASVERHLTDCADCAAEVASLADAASAIASEPTHRAPDSLRRDTLAAAAATTQAGGPGRAAGRSRRRVVTWVASAAAVAVVATVGIGVALNANGGAVAPGPLDVQMMSILSAPDAQTTDLLWGEGSYVVVSDSRQGAIVMMHAVEAPTAGSEYQVWMLMEDGSTHPSSTFMPDFEGKAMAVVSGDMAHVVALAITAEPHGGSVAPTGDVLATADL